MPVAAAPMEVAPPEDGKLPPVATNAADSRYSFNEEKMQALKKESPWTKEAKYFDKVAISPSAIMKMVCL
jgi:COP9 signalosome complex subunit 5